MSLRYNLWGSKQQKVEKIMTDKQAVGENTLAQDVTFEEYMAVYAAYYSEWVEGVVIKLSPVARKHDVLFQFLIHLLRVYCNRTKAGLLMTAPFVMRITPTSGAREPDLHIVLTERAAIVGETMTAGPADVVIEIVSPESVQRDKEEKFAEYQAGGVREYWLFDPTKKETFFYHLDDTRHYQLIALDNGIFRSRVLSHFWLNTPVLWQDPLPDDKQIDAMITAMLKEDE